MRWLLHTRLPCLGANAPVRSRVNVKLPLASRHRNTAPAPLPGCTALQQNGVLLTARQAGWPRLHRRPAGVKVRAAVTAARLVAPGTASSLLLHLPHGPVCGALPLACRASCMENTDAP